MKEAEWSALPGWIISQREARGWQWRDAREVECRKLLGWGWNPVDAAFSAYYGKPFSVVLEQQR